MTGNEVWLAWCRSMEQLRSEDGIPGLAIAMVQDGKDISVQCYGVRDVRSRAPVTPQTLFHIASTQKSATAMFIGTLVDDGLCSWDTPLAELVPKFRLFDDDANAKVSMRHLLGMCGGIPASAQDQFDEESSVAEDLFDYIAQVGLQSRPGERFDYSNLSYAIAGYAGTLTVGGVWGRLEEDFASEIHKRILTPIDMKDATFSAKQARRSGDFSVSHRRKFLGRVSFIDEVVAEADPLAPAGALRASVTDMAKYISTQLQQGIAPLGNRVISAGNLAETWRPQVRDPVGNHYAMGWCLEQNNDGTILFHEGNYAGYLALIAMIPAKRTGIVVLCNMDNNDQFLDAAFSEWMTALETAAA